MKNLLLLTVLVVILSACKKDAEPEMAKFDSDKFPQKWQLYSAQGRSIANSPILKGSDLNMQEFYILYADGTASKTREANGTAKTIQGKFRFTEVDSQKFLEVTYETRSELVDNCYATPVEQLYVKSNSEIQGITAMCDRAHLVYSRTE
ncbi:hypothetical protein DSL64_10415 [Dyadobacter luteus]|jgi:hypothetical protein|uniref:Lipocalin-like domain-containing protein n=1 Tax=Dyadobacter luteus TaxID=2259619 RepID=A0A3D8YCE4_9BACT|nr:hypothetical protein [Dyadobacter luteus]REA62062.1 hypothetical protein DSL64_10415 [Dyadobacter luteus]